MPFFQATHFGLVDKVRIHNFHLYCYIKVERVHARITQSSWDLVKILLPYISGKPRVKIAFDKFLCPAIAAWKNHKPYTQIVCDIWKSLTNIITTCIHILQKHPSLWAFTRGTILTQIARWTLKWMITSLGRNWKFCNSWAIPLFPLNNPNLVLNLSFMSNKA